MENKSHVTLLCAGMGERWEDGEDERSGEL